MDASADFRIGRVIGRTFRILARHAALFVALSALLMAPLLLMGINGATHPHAGVPFGSRTLTYQIAFVFFVVGFVAVLAMVQYALQALLVARALDDAFEGPSGMAAGLRSMASVCAIGVLSAAGIALGLGLLAVPGLFLMTAWSVAVPVCVSERGGILASLHRSMILTEGCRWKILGLLTINFALWLGLEFATVALVEIPFLGLYLTAAHKVVNDIVQWGILVAVAMTGATGTAALYVELRLVKEGLGTEQLASAFD